MTRLNKFIAENTEHSRRGADRLIADGRVRVNGQPAEMGVTVSVDDVVEIDGHQVNQQTEDIYIAFYKPRGYLTAYGEDAEGKKTLDEFEVLRKRKPAYSGRLDYYSEGLILFTTDGDLIYKMQRPEFKVEKEYFVSTAEPLDEMEMSQIRDGLKTEKIKYKPCKIAPIGDSAYKLILIEGKYRQIRTMFEHFDIQTRRLTRTRIGPIKIGNLRPGEHFELSKKQIRELKEAAGFK